MLWFKKRPEALAGNDGETEVVEPVALSVDLDGRVFAQKFASLLEALGEVGGIDPFLESLGVKSRLFAEALSRPALAKLDLAHVELLLETVMPARKRIGPVLLALGEEPVRLAITELLYGRKSLVERVVAFVHAIPVGEGMDPKAAKKIKRAIYDFGAEMLHFRAPEQYPLMTKWVWDQYTHSGAMRELVKGGDTLDKVLLGTEPGVYEAGRRWVAERMSENGMYRDPHFVVDIFFAHAYADYMRALSSGMGLLNADFGGKSDPLEVVRKLLGIDQARRKESRVAKVLH